MNMYCYGQDTSAGSPCAMELKFDTEIKPVIGGGTNDYEALNNKPRINGVELFGDKTNEELLIAAISNEEIEQLLKAFK